MAQRIPNPLLPRSPNGPNGYEIVRFEADLTRALDDYLRKMVDRVNGSMAIDGSTPMTGDLNLNGNDIVGMSLSGSPSTFYQSGSFTPVVIGATTAGVGTYGTREGYWRRIGDLFFFAIGVNYTAHTGTGQLQITGIPQGQTGAFSKLVDIETSGLTFTGVPSAFVNSAGTLMLRQMISGGNPGGINIVNGSVTIRASGFYAV